MTAWIPAAIESADNHHEARPNELSDGVLAIVRDAAQRLTASSWTAHTVSTTISGFVADLVSGYSTLDLEPDELRMAALAAGMLICAAALTGRSIGQLLDAVDLRDELEAAR
jgi:hypothetical protein